MILNPHGHFERMHSLSFKGGCMKQVLGIYLEKMRFILWGYKQGTFGATTNDSFQHYMHWYFSDVKIQRVFY